MKNLYRLQEIGKCSVPSLHLLLRGTRRTKPWLQFSRLQYSFVIYYLIIASSFVDASNWILRIGVKNMISFIAGGYNMVTISVTLKI